MLRALHRRLLSHPLTRRFHLRTARWIRRGLGIRDPYFDLLQIAAKQKPAAILDIGSFVGETIDLFLQGTDLPIHGFEPTPSTFAKLAARFGSHPQVKLHATALGREIGQVTFHGNQNPQTNSILDNDVGNLQSFPGHTKHLESLTVPITTLDAWISDWIPEGMVVIKADVQGAEGHLLDGGCETFSRRVLAFYTEVQLAPMYVGQADFFRLHERLQAWGFALHNIYECHHDPMGRATQTDALWIKEDQLSNLR